jgi:hypothetical protein
VFVIASDSPPDDIAWRINTGGAAVGVTRTGGSRSCPWRGNVPPLLARRSRRGLELLASPGRSWGGMAYSDGVTIWSWPLGRDFFPVPGLRDWSVRAHTRLIRCRTAVAVVLSPGSPLASVSDLAGVITGSPSGT